MGFVYHPKSSSYRVCIFSQFASLTMEKNNHFISFSNFAKKVSGHDIVCVPFLESACNTEKNDTKYNIEFRILNTIRTPRTMQSLNLASDTQAWCTVRPYSQAAAFYRVDLHPRELIQTARFYHQVVKFDQMCQNKF